jgi:23S rRNA (guanosine2251-2'-O)-methyltransferase
MQTLIAGRKPVLEALRAGRSIERIHFFKGAQGRTIELIRSLAEQKGIPISIADKQVLRELAPDATTQGVIAVLPPRRFVSVDAILAKANEQGKRGFIVILDEIEDPRNLGALVRTAECAGVQGIIIPKHHSAPVSPAAVKASAGATEHIAIAEVTNVVNTIDGLKKEGYWVVGLDAEGNKEYTALDYSSPTALVVGNEGRGIRRLVREHCDHLVRIPLRGKIRSLNASVAGALAMYEVVRQRSGR